MDSGTREFEYKPRWTSIVFGTVLFGAGAAILGNTAAHNHHGLIINGIIELGPGAATVFFWFLTVCSIGFVALNVLIAYHRLTYRQRIVFGPDAMTVPVSQWSREEKEIAYRDIQDVSTTVSQGIYFLYITHSGGKFTITSSKLPSKAVFEEVCELLAERMRAQPSKLP